MSMKNLDRHNRWQNKTVAFRVCPETGHRVQGQKVFGERAAQNEILCPKGAWGRCPQQADGRKYECVLTRALLASI